MINWDNAPAGAQIYANGSYFRQSPRYYREAEVWSVKYELFAPTGVKLEDLKGYEDYQENPKLEIVKVKEMITDLKVGDYIEKSELDTEQKYNDVVGVLISHGFEWGDGATEGYRYLTNGYCLTVCKDGLWQASSDRYKERKLTYKDTMSLKKVDVDNCNVDKVVNDECFREDSTAKEMLKAAKAMLAMESLGHEWDEEKGQWFRKEYF